MCKISLTLHQRVLPPGPKNITVFMIATTQGEKKLSVVKSSTGGAKVKKKKEEKKGKKEKRKKKEGVLWELINFNLQC